MKKLDPRPPDEDDEKQIPSPIRRGGRGEVLVLKHFIMGVVHPQTRTQFSFSAWLSALNGFTGKSSRFALQPPPTIRFVAKQRKRK